jgi:hypothetical protein
MADEMSVAASIRSEWDPQPSAPVAGLTRTDLLVTIAVAAVLAAVVIAPISVTRQSTRLRLCQDNLQQVGRAVLQYSEDHDATLPGLFAGQSGDLWWWYKEQVKGYAGLTGPSSTNDHVFACPMDRGYSDPRPFFMSARFDYGSYVYNGVPLFATPNIAGWKRSALRQPDRTLLVMEWTAHAPLSWHRSRTGRANAPFYRDAESVAAFADGHVRLTRMYYDGYNAAYTRDPISGYDYRYSGN